MRPSGPFAFSARTPSHRFMRAAAAALALVAAPITAHADNPNGPAEFHIGTRVLAPEPERFGVNIMNQWIQHNWTNDPGMEPIVIRHKFEVTGGGPDHMLAWEKGGTSVWDTIGDHFFDGARIRIYRYAQGNQGMELLRDTTVKFYHAPPSPTAPETYRIDLADTGPAPAFGDVAFLSMTLDNAPLEKLHERMTWIPEQDTWEFVPAVANSPSLHKVRDPSTVAPVDGGRTSLRVSSASPGSVVLGQYRYRGIGEVGEFLVPGRSYTLRAWMKQTGLPQVPGQPPDVGQVSFFMSEAYSSVASSWLVGPQWQEYSYTFIAPEWPMGASASRQAFAFEGPGTVWFDNVVVHETGKQPFAIRDEILQALKAFKPGSIRIWSGHTNTEWGTSLESWTNPDVMLQQQWATNAGRQRPIGPSLHTMLTLCEQLGANPWLIVNQSFDEQEWRDLIDFLAGPTWTPYGAKRAALGRVEPWTSAFKRIDLEYGNESWNWIFAPWAQWPAFNYGQQAQRFFAAAKSNPHFAPVGDRLNFVLNGWVIQGDQMGFGYLARGESRDAETMNLTAYTGGWELGGTLGGSVLNDEGYLDTLMFLPAAHRYMVDKHVKTRDQAAQNHIGYTLSVYEGGPGYALPSWPKVFNPIMEEYGKSLANAVSTLDCFLYGSMHQVDPHSYFAFAPGPNWSSHTLVADGFRPHAMWLGLQMRNACVPDGSQFVSVNAIKTPTLDMPGNPYSPPTPAAPMVGCYAMRKPGEAGQPADWSIFVLSRKLSGPTPVTMRLPVPPVGPFTLHSLAGDPKATNLQTMNVQMQTQGIKNLGQTFQFQMPPGSIYLFRFRTAQ